LMAAARPGQPADCTQQSSSCCCMLCAGCLLCSCCRLWEVLQHSQATN
jgi:hypothetical protein